MSDPRLTILTAALKPAGVIGVSVADWNDKTTWTIWCEGSREINALSDAKAAPIVQSFPTVPPADDPLSGWDLVTLKICLNQENRLRALEGKPQITVAQFKAAIVAL
jgi:hypothetical protein